MKEWLKIFCKAFYVFIFLIVVLIMMFFIGLWNGLKKLKNKILGREDEE